MLPAGVGLLLKAGLTIAFTAASYFLRPSQNVERGRVAQIPLQQSDYGGMIPLVFGTVRIGGNVIWASELREESDTESVGKGLGAKNTITNFTYFVDLAIMLMKGRVTDVLRVWADGKLIFDKTGANEVTGSGELDFRILDGNATQQPDALIQADIDAKFGAGSTPAYRGRSVIVFENLGLERFFNRIPNFSFEVVVDVGSNDPPAPSVVITDGEPGNQETTAANAFPDWDRATNYLGSRGGIGGGEDNTQVIAQGSLNFLREIPVRTTDRGGCVNPVNGDIAAKRIASGNIGIMDSITGAVKVTKNIGIGAWEGGKNFCYNPLDATTVVAFVGIDKTTVGLNEFRISITDTSLDIIAQQARPTDSYTVMSPTPSKDGMTYCGFASVNDIILYGVGVSPSSPAFAVLTDHTNVAGNKVDFGILKTFVPSDFGGTVFGSNVPRLAYDRSSGDVLIFFEMDTKNYAARWDPSNTLVWLQEIPYLPGRTNAQHARITGSTFAFADSDQHLTLIDVRTGQIDPIFDGQTVIAAMPTMTDSIDAIWDEVTFALYYPPDRATSNERFLRRIQLGTGNVMPVSLADYVSDVCINAGYEPIAAFDVSELIPFTLPGNVISQQTSARNALQPMSDVYFFDGIESDYKLKFLTRGRATTAFITEDEFLRTGSDSDETFTATRVQEPELPRSVRINYLDGSNAYQKATAHDERGSFPANVVLSDNTQTIDVPAVIDNDFARQAAQKLLYTKWNERDGFDFASDWTFLASDPSDVMQVTFNDGFVADVRLEQADIGADLTMEIRNVVQSSDQYASTLTGQAGSSLQTTLTLIEPSQLFLLDIPYLQDVDVVATGTGRYYWAGNNLTPNDWVGGRLQDSQDSNVFALRDALTVGTPWGVLTVALGLPTTFNTWDTEGSITFASVNGDDQFSSSTDLEVLNGANAVAIFRDNALREVEIVQFVDVTVNANGSITLSRLLRGRRGTEVFGTTSHIVGERICLLSAILTGSWVHASSEFGSIRFYRVVTAGQSPDDALVETYTPQARSLRPYAPVHHTAVLNGSDIDLTVVRRTRFGGELLDGTGVVPLNEDTELYEIEILDGPGGTILRTITGVTAPSYKYLAADIATDFGSIAPTTLSLIWYQISAQVGRGFPGEATVTVG